MSGAKHRVVITGMGAVCGLGDTLPTVWTRLLAGDSAIAPISFFDAGEYGFKVASEVRNLGDASWRSMDNYDYETGLESAPAGACRRPVSIFLKAALDARDDAGWDEFPADPYSCGVAVGGSVTVIDHEQAVLQYHHRDQRGTRVDLAKLEQSRRPGDHSFWRRQGSLIAAVAAKRLQCGGPALTVDTACAASGHAIGKALQLLRRGEVRMMLAGGASALVGPIGMLYFHVLGALSRNPSSEEASRPFDQARDGFVMGEGGGAIVLETLESAQERGANIYAELVGYGATMNADTLTDPSPDGASESAAISLALEDGGLRPEEIGYVAAHGTSTPKGDITETLAIKRALGAQAGRLVASSNKGQIGHTIAGSAVLNLICAVQAIRDGYAPPTMHLRNPDPQCDLDYAPNAPKRIAAEAALANSFGFGGQNAALAVRRFEA